jgi:hypothetical protein
MSWPPMLMHIKVKNKDANFSIWLPLFLLLPVVFVILLALSPLILIAIIILWETGWGKMAIFGLKAAFVALWYLRGLKVDVQGPKECVSISVI